MEKKKLVTVDIMSKDGVAFTTTCIPSMAEECKRIYSQYDSDVIFDYFSQFRRQENERSI